MGRDNTPNESSGSSPGVDGGVESNGSTDVSEENGVNPSRRAYLQLVGGGVIISGGFDFEKSDTETVDVGGPPDQSNMSLVLEDRFNSNSIDTSNWGVGWGWGKTTRNSPTRVTSENVRLHNGKLHLKGTHKDDDILSGSVHTRNKVTVGPGTYFEARIKFPDRDGFLPAFWAKPNDETWPPEIDVVELFQKGNGKADTHTSHHSLHYSNSTTPGDRSTYEATRKPYRPGDDLTENFHVYGVDWRPDRVVHYVDGEQVMKTADSTLLKALNKATPFYLLCSLEIDKIGTADKSESWGESVVIDWVRVWE